MRKLIATSVAVLILAASPWATSDEKTANVAITQSHLVGLCLNGEALKGDRKWTAPAGPQSIEFTMRNEPRTGIASAEPGTAAITFVADAGHRYEVEVRAEATTFSTRVWAQGKWAPVVRDRTIDRIVSSEPVWQAASCVE